MVAQAWSALIKRATGRQIDGAFAIDPMAIAQLLGDRALHVDAFSRPLNAGNLVQMTRDQTWVNRMVEIGAFTPEEAEQHPRRNELQQAIGGHPEVEPAVYEASLKPGDWVIVCSDGLTNHLPPDTIKEILQSSASAEAAARRLINLTNLAGATDNATVVAIRAT